ncbi:tetratricopeptide repeat protein [Kitasatospora viridis]|uniref:Tfp pilus assembly protein PilF n=1 Tax=Kitasatospora viridis TaxID=281105 RepID=A0A561SDG1_9ACTN|nr:tetratricopeptide repeat protein [Kitasatospora viridis]TWF72875.1 Tfp pilus assembly protein PilF [Kitasatospora viridis]
MSDRPRHRWIVGPADLASPGGWSSEVPGWSQLPPALLAPINAHRRLRGPYTAAGTLARELHARAGRLAGQAAGQLAADALAAHDVELLTVAPELRLTMAATRETLTSLAVPSERTRFYSRLRTLRIAHGLTECLRDVVAAMTDQPVSLWFDRVDEADPLDREFLGVLVRRLDPALLTLVIATREEPPADGELAAMLAQHAERFDVVAPQAPDRLRPEPVGALLVEQARSYVATECLSTEPELARAYESLPEAERRVLHDWRAEELEALDSQSLRLGAIPFHRELGTDPAGPGAAALEHGLNYCIDHGFYEATVDFGKRGRALIDWSAAYEQWWTFTTKTTTSLAALGRPVEAEELYDEARAFTVNPTIHMQAAYATAMLYTRHHDEDRKDHHKAMAWINQAIAIAHLLPDPKERAFNTVFHKNGRALIEGHLARPEDALRLVAEGLERLDHDLGTGEHLLHRSVLRHNRAQVLSGLGRLDEALADFQSVIEADPNYAEYHFDAASVLRRLGRTEEALAEYDTAIRLSPPFPEVYYNRGDLRAACGDIAGAVADFAYVVEIDPGFVDAYVNLAGLLLQEGEAEQAGPLVAAALERAPEHPHLHSLAGRLAMDSGDLAAARAELDAAIALDETLAEAWATRAAVVFEQDDLTGALADLDRAVALLPDPAMLFNRGTVREALGQWKEAIADFDEALAADPDEPDALLHRAICRGRTGDRAGAAADRERFLLLAPDREEELTATA